MPQTNALERQARIVMLYKREGSADKVYQASLQPAEGGLFNVIFRNARRGSPLKLAKELAGLSWDAALAAFDKQVASKKREGYTEQEDGQAYTSSEFAGRDSGMRPQLPKPVSAEQAEQLVADPVWCLQLKANGENRMLHGGPDGVRGSNKKGLWVDIPQHWVEQLQRATDQPFVLCGEHVGETLFVFDALMIDGQDLRSQSFEHRLTVLESALSEWRVSCLELIPAFFDEQDKAQVLAAWREGRLEGGVFKRKDQPHIDGYSDACLKYKFCESSACQVLGRNGDKRSVAIGLLDDAGCMVPVGNVTIPANADIPCAGDVIEVQYLYFNPGGAFEQPVYLFKRGDMEPAECRMSQVTRIKPQDEAEAVADRPRMRA